ncbi:MAG: thymidylate synthase [Bacteroidales bacterium]|nr:thymidylate synthase [Bacteroidales bacterium]
MSRNNILSVKNRAEFREWLSLHHADESECWVSIKRGNPLDDSQFYYLDAVEEALCFGWIDSTQALVDGSLIQRFSPRRKGSPWTELNKERVRRLEKLGLMTDAGRVVLPDLGQRSFKVDSDVEKALKESRVWSKFKRFPELYQRIRAYNVIFYKKRNAQAYEKALKHLIEETRKEKMFGEWNDYGRLLDY